MGGFELVEEVDGFDGGEGGFCAFVACFGAGSFDGLFDGVGGEHAEGDREAGLERDALDPGCALTGNVFEVGGGTADDGTEADHGIVGAASGEVGSIG